MRAKYSKLELQEKSRCLFLQSMNKVVKHYKSNLMIQKGGCCRMQKMWI